MLRLFMLYIVLGHRIANIGSRDTAQLGRPASIDRLVGAMATAAVIATPWGLSEALPAFGHPMWLVAGAGVGVRSSVIPT
jgi:inner membrane transporter RhtA